MTSAKKAYTYPTYDVTCFFLLRHFAHWNISVICLTVVLKLAVTVFLPYIFRHSDRNDLTLWELAYDIFILRFQPKNSSFQLLYQRHSSSAYYTRELFKGSNGSASLLVCTQKFFWLGVADFLWRKSPKAARHQSVNCFRSIQNHFSLWPKND